MPKDAPPSLLLSLMEDPERKRGGLLRLSYNLPFRSELTWLAPIRTKPRRTYDGFKTNFSPEGDHTPHVLRKVIHSKERGRKFTKLLSNFGNHSGLFKSVSAHSFGKDPSAPFEVHVKLYDQPINISNVGYGVSQVLPLVVEMLTRPKGHWFAIQQPEVHIHPKAQAALGDLIHFLALEEKHKYYIETHSDCLIDRFRLGVKLSKGKPSSQVLFFEREIKTNKVCPIKIDSGGRYPEKQPRNFRDFFINEELKLLDI